MRSDVDGLDDAADGPGLDELACFDRSFDLEALAVHDGVDFFGFGDGLANGGEIFESGDAGLVAEHVFAVRHGANANGGAPVGDLRGEDELGGRIIDDLVLGGDDFYIGEALFEGGELSSSPPQAETRVPPPRW